MTTELLAYRHGVRTHGEPLHVAQGIARQYCARALREFWRGYLEGDAKRDHS